MKNILKDFANWLWDNDRLRINSQIPGIKNADEIVESYLRCNSKKVSIDITKSLKLENLIINPLDKDGNFEISIDDFDVMYTFLSKENAIKLAQYILASVNH